MGRSMPVWPRGRVGIIWVKAEILKTEMLKSNHAADGFHGLFGGGEGIGEGEYFGGEVAGIADFLEGGDDGFGVGVA